MFGDMLGGNEDSSSEFAGMEGEILMLNVREWAKDLEIWADDIEITDPETRYDILRKSVQKIYQDEINRENYHTLKHEETAPAARHGLRMGAAGAKAYLDYVKEQDRLEGYMEKAIERFKNSDDFSQRRATSFDSVRGALVDGFTSTLDERSVQVTRDKGDGEFRNAYVIGAKAVEYGFNNAPSVVVNRYEETDIEDWEDLIDPEL